MLSILLTLLGMVAILLVVQFLLSLSFFLSDPQLVMLEAGFENMKPSMIFSSAFFILIALFVLFDMELIILLPGLLMLQKTGLFCLCMWMGLFFAVLITLMVEWSWCGLKWQS